MIQKCQTHDEKMSSNILLMKDSSLLSKQKTHNEEIQINDIEIIWSTYTNDISRKNKVINGYDDFWDEKVKKGIINDNLRNKYKDGCSKFKIKNG